MGRADLVSRNEAAEMLESIIHQLREGAMRVGDSQIDIPAELLLSTKIRKGEHEGIQIKLSWDVLEEDEQEDIQDLHRTLPYEV